MCGGLAVSFSLLGVTVSLAARAFGFDPNIARIGGAALLMLLGLSLLIPRAQEWFSRLLAPLASKASSAATGNPSFWGNFLTGTLLGAVWSPCSGPALGTAVGLAAEARTVPHAFILMLVFSLAACLPLLAIAYGARAAFLANRSRLIALSLRAKPAFGLLLVIAAAIVLVGWDKQAEAAVVSRLPATWIDLMAKF